MEIRVFIRGRQEVCPVSISVLIRGKAGGSESTEGDTKTELIELIGAMRFEDGERGHEPGNTGSLEKRERAKNEFLPDASRKNAANTLILDYQPPKP